MTKFKNPFKGVKVEYTRSHPLTKIVVIAIIVVCMVSLIALRLTGSSLKAKIEELRKEATHLEVENQELGELVDGQDSVEGLEQVAEDELGLVDPDTIVIDPNP